LFTGVLTGVGQPTTTLRKRISKFQQFKNLSLTWLLEFSINRDEAWKRMIFYPAPGKFLGR